jgi:hypothetical protein
VTRSSPSLSWAALALVALTAGCSNPSTPKPGAGGATASPSPRASASSSPVASATPLPVAVAAVAGAIPGLTLAINSLHSVDSRTLLLTVTMTNTGAAPYSFNGSWREPGYGDPIVDRDLGGATLFDPAAHKRYLVLRDAASRCLCSTNLGQGGTGNDGLSMGPGDAMTFFAYFPAPIASTTSLQVSLPQFTPVSVDIS